MNASREQTFMRVVGKTRGSFYFKNQFSYFFVKNLLILKLKLVKYLKCEKVNTDPNGAKLRPVWDDFAA
jgi:hypothetical protein